MSPELVPQHSRLRVTVTDTVKILSRQGFLLFPVVAGTFVIIAGGLGTEFGLPNLFRDLPGEFDRPPGTPSGPARPGPGGAEPATVLAAYLPDGTALGGPLTSRACSTTPSR